MTKLILLIVLVALGAGGAYVYLYFDMDVQQGEDGTLHHVKFTPKGRKEATTAIGRAASSPLRIATFNLGWLDEAKLSSQRVNDVLVGLLSRFDVIALQGIRSSNRGVIVRLVDALGGGGRKYDFAVCPAVRSGDVQSYSAFVFDRSKVEVDRSTVQSVQDRGGRFRHMPLVALFRVRGPAEEEAFTFKLINVHTDPDNLEVESALLDDVYRAVRDEQPFEDDVILLGDFGTSTDRIESLRGVANLTPAIVDTPTMLRANGTVDNIFFNRRATVEFTGRSEVVDVMREFDLELREAREVSDHLPVWAEFNPYEGGRQDWWQGLPRGQLGDRP